MEALIIDRTPAAGSDVVTKPNAPFTAPAARVAVPSDTSPSFRTPRRTATCAAAAVSVLAALAWLAILAAMLPPLHHPAADVAGRDAAPSVEVARQSAAAPRN